MQTLKNWTAKRSGAGLTIDGVCNATGQPVKVTNIVEIVATHEMIAEHESGMRYRLVCSTK